MGASVAVTINVTAGSGAVENTVTLSSATAVTNYPLKIGRAFPQGAIASSPQVLVDGTPVATQADVKNVYPDGSVKFAVIAAVIPSLPANVPVTLTFRDASLDSTPLTLAQMQAMLAGDAVLSVTGTTAGAMPQTTSALTMLTAGDYKLHTSGQICQTVELADDSTARTYDIGFGDGFHPLRPRFYLDFWPGRGLVHGRVVVENYLASELEDLTYAASVTIGGTTVYETDLSGSQTTHPIKHWTFTAWTRQFWIGAAPSAQVNIDHNLAYLSSIRFLPNFDPSIAPTEADIAGEYTNWTSRAGTIYGGLWNAGSLWQSGMGTTGARQEIAPYPEWSGLSLYTGDWRMRQMSQGLADIACAFPGQLRESISGKRLSRADVAGSSTGLGRCISITDRPTLVTAVPTYGYTVAADKLVFVGPFSPTTNPWSFDGAHQPSPFYPEYLTSADPWYLAEMYLWAGFSTALYNGASPGSNTGRGPTGSYGGINDQLRGAAWVLRLRAETAFIAPDADPEKAFFTYLTNDALARWEGSLGVLGTPYDGTAIKVWGANTGNYYSGQNEGPEAGKVPPFGNWESGGVPNGKDATIVNNVAAGIFSTKDGTLTGIPVAGSYTAPWTHWYLQYGLGRAAELGFAAGPLRAFTGQYPTGMILDSPDPRIIGIYEIPVEYNASIPIPAWSSTTAYAVGQQVIGSNGSYYQCRVANTGLDPTANPTDWTHIVQPMTAPPGGFMTTWEQVFSALTPQFLTGVGWPIGTGNNGAGDLDTYATSGLTDDGRSIWLAGGLAMMVDAGDPRALEAWAWYFANIYQATPAADLAADPKWAIVPRMDSNALPAIPTATP